MTLARWPLVMLPLCLVACSGTQETSLGSGTGGSAGQTGEGGSAGAAGQPAHGGSAGASGQPGSGGAAGAAGQAGGAGKGGAAGAAGSAATPECTDASGCTLHDDCCNCLALGPGEQPPSCNMPECYVSACGADGVNGVTCSAGQCVLDVSCDGTTVTCKKLPPQCPSGQIPSVLDKCWTGNCVPVALCRDVTSCGDCNPDTQVCARYTTQLGIEHHCVVMPDVCKGNASCGCLGEALCMPPYDTCSSSMGDAELVCSCPAC